MTGDRFSLDAARCKRDTATGEEKPANGLIGTANEDLASLAQGDGADNVRVGPASGLVLTELE